MRATCACTTVGYLPMRMCAVQDPSVAEAAGAALTRVQRRTANHVAVLTNSDYLANPRAVLEAKLPLLTQEVRPECVASRLMCPGSRIWNGKPGGRLSMSSCCNQTAREFHPRIIYALSCLVHRIAGRNAAAWPICHGSRPMLTQLCSSNVLLAFFNPSKEHARATTAPGRRRRRRLQRTAP